MLKYCFNTLILLRSSRKEFDNISVKSTLRESTPNLVCFLFLDPPKPLSILRIRAITSFIWRVRTFRLSKINPLGKTKLAILGLLVASLYKYAFPRLYNNFKTKKLLNIFWWSLEIFFRRRI